MTKILPFLLVALTLTGCAFFHSKAAKDLADEGACVASHYEELANSTNIEVTAIKVAVDCGNIEKQLVLDLFSGQKAAVSRHFGAAPCASSSVAK
jgi:hypothetical protein